LFVSISQVIGCEDRLRNDLYCVGWGVKLYSNQICCGKMEYGRVSRIMSRKLNETILVYDSVQKNRIRLARKQKLETIQQKKQQQTGKRKQLNYTCA